MFNYIKTAFLNQWNLLLFAGGMGFAVLSGQADVAIPIVIAMETAYVGLLGTHPKFQKYVDAQSAKQERQQTSAKNQQVLDKILSSLPKAMLGRYNGLRDRCRWLGQIASDLKEPLEYDAHQPFETLQTRGLDRLLWVFLRLLFSQHRLEQFQAAVSEDQIQANLKQIDSQLGRLPENDTSDNVAKIRRTLLDNQATLKERLENYSQAKSNLLFVKLELDRVENKIKSLSELAVNRQDPEYISGQIDAVTSSMKETERTMNELQFVTGLGTLDDDAPELINETQIQS
ncbi:hypothetical protein Q31b_12150 [Novipirellula aureliae]|uniref:Uncharacterized protein n=1 Tax=Novipirellula aureliae TaxID=2527966 RepID=A0A5C6EDH1_9BACT|nr:hypothetical protein [Novipirellula aureliae]TWU46037.1 hypothetical protein Q31b_12150 [Novipirellula aureliae]